MLGRAAVTSGVVVLGAVLLAGAGPAQEPVAPKRLIRLFNGKDFTGLYTWVKKTGRKDPNKVFIVKDGVLHVSGEDNGYVATDRPWKDYRVAVEYRWGKNTFGSKYVRNSGILLHAVGPDGGAGGTWMSCIECQLAQGCVGDLIVIRGKDARGKVIPVKIKSETVLGPDKRPRWKAGGQVRAFERGQLWWSLHDPEYKELIDTRGKDDVESRVGEWTRVECVCKGGTIDVRVNGTLVNHCFDAYPAAGKILLQSEGFEMDFKTFELHPAP